MQYGGCVTRTACTGHYVSVRILYILIWFKVKSIFYWVKILKRFWLWFSNSVFITQIVLFLLPSVKNKSYILGRRRHDVQGQRGAAVLPQGDMETAGRERCKGAGQGRCKGAARAGCCRGAGRRIPRHLLRLLFLDLVFPTVLSFRHSPGSHFPQIFSQKSENPPKKS